MQEMMRRTIVYSAIILTLGVMAIVIRPLRNCLPLPLWFKHTLNLVLQPSDLYAPLIQDRFRFTEQGFSKSYTLHPRYADFHEVGFMDSSGSIPVSYQFTGILQFNLSCQGKTVREETISSMGVAWSAGNDLDHYKDISLFEFPIPLQARCKTPVLTVTVLKVDEALRALKTPPQLYVAVSATP